LRAITNLIPSRRYSHLHLRDRVDISILYDTGLTAKGFYNNKVVKDTQSSAQ